MTLQALVRAAFDATVAAHSDFVVTVVHHGTSADGWRDSKDTAASLTMPGETGKTVQRVHVNMGDMGEPGRGDEITVDSEPAVVMNTKTDPAGALMTIDYMLQREVTEDSGPR